MRGELGIISCLSFVGVGGGVLEMTYYLRVVRVN